jgi:cyanate permease
MLLSPLIGLFLDRRGHHGRLLLLGSAIMLPCYLALALSSSSPIPAVLGLGLAFSLVPTVVWPMVPLLVPEDRVGSAYGLMSMLQAVGMALVPWGSGALRDATGNYVASLLLLAGLGGACTVVGLLALRSFRGLRVVSANG